MVKPYAKFSFENPEVLPVLHPLSLNKLGFTPENVKKFI